MFAIVVSWQVLICVNDSTQARLVQREQVNTRWQTLLMFVSFIKIALSGVTHTEAAFTVQFIVALHNMGQVNVNAFGQIAHLIKTEPANEPESVKLNGLLRSGSSFFYLESFTVCMTSQNLTFAFLQNHKRHTFGSRPGC